MMIKSQMMNLDIGNKNQKNYDMRYVNLIYNNVIANFGITT